MKKLAESYNLTNNLADFYIFLCLFISRIEISKIFREHIHT